MGLVIGTGKGPKAEINVTPMVDVVLVLLIIFMVVTPLLQRGKDVQLPTVTRAKEETTKAADPLVLSVTPERELFVESERLDEAALVERLTVTLAKDPRRRLLLKGDDVRKVMNLARKAGARSISFAVQEVDP
jgi:biopolymer transport protein TolR